MARLSNKLFHLVFLEDADLDLLKKYFIKLETYTLIQFIDNPETICFLRGSDVHIKNSRFIFNYSLFWYKCVEFFGYELIILENEQKQKYPSYKLKEKKSKLLKYLLCVTGSKEEPEVEILTVKHCKTKAFLFKLLLCVKMHCGYHPLSEFFSILIEECYVFKMFDQLKGVFVDYFNDVLSNSRTNENYEILKCAIDKEKKICTKHTFRFSNEECKELFNKALETNVDCIYQMFEQ